MELLQEYRQIRMKQYSRTDRINYHVNAAIALYGEIKAPKSLHPRQRQPLTKKDKQRLKAIAVELRNSSKIDDRVIYYLYFL